MYDSVYPSRTARFGVALVPSGVLKLKNICYREDFRLAQAMQLLAVHRTRVCWRPGARSMPHPPLQSFCP